MSTKTTLAIGVIAAAALAFVAGPALIQSASAVRFEEPFVEEKRCSEDKFQERETCPGKSADAQGNPGDRENIETCTARNHGQEKNCPDGEADVVINPPK